MPISPVGTTNLASVNVPGVYVQLKPPVPVIQGVPTDVIGVVGTAAWGKKNAAVVVGTLQELVQHFGTPAATDHDLGTAVYTAASQGAHNFRCVRVSDGTDTEATSQLLDDLLVPLVGADLTAIYTGSTGNNILATIQKGSAPNSFKLLLYLDGSIPEVFDNIVGVGNQFWKNLISAVNLGQSIQRGPSKLVVASLPTSIGGFLITDPGVYNLVPTVTVADGTGATFETVMNVITADVTIGFGGTLYAVDDTIVLAGGTFTTATVLKVESILPGGIVDTVSILTAGAYTAIPSNPVAQDTSSGAGTGATFDLRWGVASITVLTTGQDYTEDSVVTFSSGTAAASVLLGSVTAPKLATFTFTGGTDGSDVTSIQLIGSDTANPRTGMYALRNAVSGGIFFVSNLSDPTYWTTQAQFANEEGAYCMATQAPGLQDDIEGAALLLENAGVSSYNFKLHLGDWDQINDPFTGLTRFVSPQGFTAGVLASEIPSESSLNKQMFEIIGTQKTLESRIYSDADLSFIRTGRLEVLTKPIQQGPFFGCKLGINTSTNPLEQTDNYPRMANFIGQSLVSSLGKFVGFAQTPDLREEARSVLATFFQQLFQLGMIGDVNNPGNFSKAVSIVLDASNNPPDSVKLGFMRADVNVVLFSIVQYFVVNLNLNQGSLSLPLSSTVTVLAPTLGGL